MAYELPVVATSRAVQGLTRVAAAGVETADSPVDMAAAIVRLLRNPELAREKGRQGRRVDCRGIQLVPGARRSAATS